MILLPDPTTAYIDPFRARKTLILHCFVADPLTLENYTRDPRYVAKKAEDYLKSTGIADTAYFGPEPEFFIFDDVRFEYGTNQASHSVDSVEGTWNTGRDEPGRNLGYKPRTKEGYFPVPPMDHYQDLRSEMVVAMLRSLGIEVELHHHEVATAGQAEIDMRFDTLLAHGRPAHDVQVRREERRLGRRQDASRSCPSRSSRTTAPACTPTSRCGRTASRCSTTRPATPACPTSARWYIGGLLHHAPAILAFAAPTTNSYKRLVPGYEAPVNLVYSQRNRSASCRIPLYSKSPKAKRVEFRCPDPSSQPVPGVLGHADGRPRRRAEQIEPPDPVDKDLYDLPPEELAKVPQVPGSLDESLDALETDSDFLQAGGVFTDDLIETWIAYKRNNEIDAIRLRPHPYEFALYYDIEHA